MNENGGANCFLTVIWLSLKNGTKVFSYFIEIMYFVILKITWTQSPWYPEKTHSVSRLMTCKFFQSLILGNRLSYMTLHPPFQISHFLKNSIGNSTHAIKPSISNQMGLSKILKAQRKNLSCECPCIARPIFFATHTGVWFTMFSPHLPSLPTSNCV